MMIRKIKNSDFITSLSGFISGIRFRRIIVNTHFNISNFQKNEIRSIIYNSTFDMIFSLIIGLIYAFSAVGFVSIFLLVIGVLRNYHNFDLISILSPLGSLKLKLTLLALFFSTGLIFWIMSFASFISGYFSIKSKLKDINSVLSNNSNYRKSILSVDLLDWDGYIEANQKNKQDYIFSEVEMKHINNLYLNHKNVSILEYEFLLDSIKNGDIYLSDYELSIKKQQFMNTTQPHDDADARRYLLSLKSKGYITNEEFNFKLAICKKLEMKVLLNLSKFFIKLIFVTIIACYCIDYFIKHI